MDAVILAGGFGTRLRSVVSDVPKPMASVCGRPFLEILASFLISNGVTRLIFSTGYMGDVIKNHFGEKFNGVKIIYSHETTPLGTGGALFQATQYVSSECFLVCNGDSFIDFSLHDLIKYQRSQGGNFLLAKEMPINDRYGSIVEQNDRILSFVPKNHEVRYNDVINAGCYLLNKNIFDECPPLAAPFSFEYDYLPKVIRQLLFRCYKNTGFFIDIGIPEDYCLAQKLLINYSNVYKN